MPETTRGFHVLLADDDPFIVSLYRERLLRLGHQVDTVQNGEDALNALQTAPPDLLVLDLNMPRLSGTEVLRYIRESSATPDLPVIVLSNVCAEDFVKKVSQLLPTRFLVKYDVTPKQVLAEIQQVLAEIALGGGVKPILPSPPEVCLAPPAPEVEGAALVDALETSEGVEARRDVLLNIYRIIQENLHSLKQANRLSLPFQFGEALEQCFEALYADPASMPPSAPQSLRIALGKLGGMVGRVGEGPTPPALLLAHSPDAGLRDMLRTCCDRLGLKLLLAGEPETAFDLVGENALTLLIWHAPRAGALRKAMRHIDAFDHAPKIRTLLLVPQDIWAEVDAEWRDGSRAVLSLPLLAPELLANLYVFRN